MSASLSSSPNKITGHYGYPSHKLNPAGKEAMLHVCGDCKDQIFGLDSSYKCTDCKDVKYFHKACLNAKPNSPPKEYPFNPEFKLKFSTSSSPKIHCTACRSFVKGIMYTGSHVKKDYHLHPQCIDLPPNLSHKSIKLELCCRMQTSMKCDVCGTGDDGSWCYGVISDNEFKFARHVRCQRDRIANDWFKKRIPVKLPNREAYLKSLYQDELRKITLMAGALGLEAAALGLDVITSAFVGAPLATLISLALDVSVGVAQNKLEAAEKELRKGKLKK